MYRSHLPEWFPSFLPLFHQMRNCLKQGEELLPEPFPGGNVPGILPEAPAVPAPATDVSQVVEEAMPAVVAVASTAVYQMPDFGFGWFFGGGSQSYEVPSSGSGIIIGENDTELLIVTNNHVVQDTVYLKDHLCG